MQHAIKILIEQIEINFLQIENCNDIKNKTTLVNQTSSILNKLQTSIKQIPSGNQKILFLKQVDIIKDKVHQIYQQLQHDHAMASRIQLITLGIMKDSLFGIQGFQQKLQYNPRISAEQNIIRSIIWMDISEQRLMLKNSEIQQIAKQMENTKEVYDEIAKLVKEQGEQLDIITSHIQKANQNVKEARNNILIANMYQGGDKVQLNKNGDIRTINGQQISSVPKLTDKRLVLNLAAVSSLDYIRASLRSRAAEFGFSIKSFLSNIFTRKNQKQVAE